MMGLRWEVQKQDFIHPITRAPIEKYIIKLIKSNGFHVITNVNHRGKIISIKPSPFDVNDLGMIFLKVKQLIREEEL